jgi:hypothetical protein
MGNYPTLTAARATETPTRYRKVPSPQSRVLPLRSRGMARTAARVSPHLFTARVPICAILSEECQTPHCLVEPW